MDREGEGVMLPGAANDRCVQGLPLTVKLLEKYRLMQECARHPAPDSPRSCDCDPRAILESLRCSRGSTADVIEKIDLALKAAQVAADAGGYGYKVEAFTRRYIQGETYEDIADAMNCGRNSPARWCKEIMEEMAIRLFGVNGITW